MQFTYTDTNRDIYAHRNPTKAEIRFGHGATHYKDMPRSLFETFIVAGKKRFFTMDEANDCANDIFKKTRCLVSIEKHLKKWIVCPIDGLRYYR